jgi:hypothetical protein
VHAKDDPWLARLGYHLAVRDRVQMLHPRLFRRIARIPGCLAPSTPAQSKAI